MKYDKSHSQASGTAVDSAFLFRPHPKCTHTAPKN